jgi:hypothetical protein
MGLWTSYFLNQGAYFTLVKLKLLVDGCTAPMSWQLSPGVSCLQLNILLELRMVLFVMRSSRNINIGISNNVNVVPLPVS